jgi:hypothetical protein
MDLFPILNFASFKALPYKYRVALCLDLIDCSRWDDLQDYYGRYDEAYDDALRAYDPQLVEMLDEEAKMMAEDKEATDE